MIAVPTLVCSLNCVPVLLLVVSSSLSEGTRLDRYQLPEVAAFRVHIDRPIIPFYEMTLVQPLYSINTRQNRCFSEDADFDIVTGHRLNFEIARGNVCDELLGSVPLKRIGKSTVGSHYSAENSGVAIQQGGDPLAAHSSHFVLNLTVGGVHGATPFSGSNVTGHRARKTCIDVQLNRFAA
jgi:hypothetical protein